MKILITGGAGYVGSKLVPALLGDGHEVLVYDLLFFGDEGLAGAAAAYPRDLKIVKADIRDTEAFERACEGADAVIHLACISNDPSFELDEALSRTMNYECFQPMVRAAKRQGVRRFLYVSTSSVYGISDSPDVTEDHPLVPVTLYNTYKGYCEPQLLAECTGAFEGVILRPSTICGYSPRQRLDLCVNTLTNQAVNAGKITVFGGAQMRPNLHIDDMVDVLMRLLHAPAALVNRETFNCGAANYSIRELANIVAAQINPDIPIIVTESMDTRSYQVSSAKIRRVLGYRAERTVEDGVRDLVKAFRAGLLPNSLSDDRYYNVKVMHKVWADIYRDAAPVDVTAGYRTEIDAKFRTGATGA